MPDHQHKPRSEAVPASAQATAHDLFAAIEDLTNPTRERSDPKDPKSPWVTTPPLWDLLLANVAMARRGSVQLSARSSPPVITEVLSLVQEIRDHCASLLRQAGRKPIMRRREVPVELRERVQARPDSTVIELWRDIPAELRAINSLLTPRPHAREAWGDMVGGWVMRARVALGLIPPRLALPRGLPCLDCGKAWVMVEEDGKEVRRPALHLVWQDDGQRIHYVRCDACGRSRWPHDLHALAEGMAQANATVETLGVALPDPSVTT